MNSAQPNTAVLLFAHNADNESFHKKFYSSRKIDRAFWNGANKRVASIAAESSLDFFHIHSNLQKGKTFGDRLVKAVKDIFNTGYDRVIILGNDCPALSTTDILKSSSALDQYPLVFGEDERGGVYLLAIDKCIFDEKAFLDLCWNSKHLVKSLIQFAHNSDLPFYSIGVKADLNSRKELINYIKFDQFFKKIYQSLLEDTRNFTRRYIHFLKLSLSHFSLRGPPVTL